MGLHNAMCLWFVLTFAKLFIYNSVKINEESNPVMLCAYTKTFLSFPSSITVCLITSSNNCRAIPACRQLSLTSTYRHPTQYSSKSWFSAVPHSKSITHFNGSTFAGPSFVSFASSSSSSFLDLTTNTGKFHTTLAVLALLVGLKAVLPIEVAVAVLAIDFWSHL